VRSVTLLLDFPNRKDYNRNGMDKEEMIREAMRELGRKSAAARKEKLGKDYMKDLIKKGADARRGSGKSEPLAKKKATKPHAKKKIRTVKKSSLNMTYEP
jgi:hypothetical protein